MAATTLERDRVGLLVASRLWATRRPLDEERVEAARHALLLANHRRYVASAGMYARLASDVGRTEPADVAEIVDNLMVGVGYFKSYGDAVLERGDFAGLTAWVDDISTLRPKPRLDGVRSIADWCARMRSAGVAVTISSGTSGRPSFVPRDGPTLSALRNNGRCYSSLAWGGYADGAPVFDAVLVTGSEGVHGIDAVAHGLATLADRSVYVGGADDAAGFASPLLAATSALLVAAARDRRRVLVFGSPPSIVRLCDALLATTGAVQLPENAMLVTGGGWKTGVGERMDTDAFAARVREALGVPAERTVDVYGLSECNAYLLRCSHGRYHVPPVLEAVVLGDDLRARKGTDEAGLIGLLDPFAFCYPGFLLTGDWGRLVRSPCACGLTGPGFVGSIVRHEGQDPKGCAGAASGLTV